METTERRKKPPPSFAEPSKPSRDETRPLLRRRTASNMRHQTTQVYPLINRIKRDMLNIVDTPLSSEQLAAPKIQYNLIRPLEAVYLELDNVSIIYSLLVVRCHFQRDQTHTLSLHSVNATRAALCEIVATNILRTVYDRETRNPDSTASDALLKASELLAAAFSPFQGAPPSVLEALKQRSPGYRPPNDCATGISYEPDESEVMEDTVIDELPYGKNNALEMAIVGEAKMLIRSPPAQLVVQAIWTGMIVYSPTTFWDLMPDHYKRRQISLHKPSHSIYLDHYRLRVPRIRAFLELLQFLVLFGLWVGVLQTRTHFKSLTKHEVVFLIYGFGWALDRFASTLEHGWRVYSANLWNGLDTGLMVNFLTYAVLRMIGLLQTKTHPHEHFTTYWSIDILSLGALMLFPRFVFTVLSDNVFILSLRAMLSQFVYLMLLAAWCFLGVLYSLWLMAEHNGHDYSLAFIGKLMIWIWFGLDGTGIHIARNFNPIIGPVLWVIYSCLANTLLLTILVAILSNTFSNVSHDPASEGMYRRAVTTFDGLKSDAIFGFMPGFNLVALVVLTTIRPFVSRRKYHSATVLLTRIFSGPILLCIAVFETAVERQRRHELAQELTGNKENKSFWTICGELMTRFRPRGAHDDISLVFELAAHEEGEDHHPQPGSAALAEPYDVDALFKGMPSLSPAARAQLKGTHLRPPASASSKGSEAGESRILPLARLFGLERPSTPAQATPVRPQAQRAASARREAAPSPRRPETPQPASAASMQDDSEHSDRLAAIEERLDDLMKLLSSKK